MTAGLEFLSAVIFRFYENLSAYTCLGTAQYLAHPKSLKIINVFGDLRDVSIIRQSHFSTTHREISRFVASHHIHELV